MFLGLTLEFNQKMKKEASLKFYFQSEDKAQFNHMFIYFRANS
jgi:hypothetical protein